MTTISFFSCFSIIGRGDNAMCVIGRTILVEDKITAKKRVVKVYNQHILAYSINIEHLPA